MRQSEYIHRNIAEEAIEMNEVKLQWGRRGQQANCLSIRRLNRLV